MGAMLSLWCTTSRNLTQNAIQCMKHERICPKNQLCQYIPSPTICTKCLTTYIPAHSFSSLLWGTTASLCVVCRVWIKQQAYTIIFGISFHFISQLHKLHSLTHLCATTWEWILRFLHIPFTFYQSIRSVWRQSIHAHNRVAFVYYHFFLANRRQTYSFQSKERSENCGQTHNERLDLSSIRRLCLLCCY